MFIETKSDTVKWNLFPSSQKKKLGHEICLFQAISCD